MLQTSSGRTVNVSSCGLARAATLLGLEEDDKNFALKGFGSAQNQDSMKTKGESSHGIFSRNMSCVTASTLIVDPSNVRLVERSPDNFLKGYFSAGSHLNSGQLQKTLAHKTDCSNFTQSPVKFQTAGGRYISISNDALNRARNLLGDSDIGTLENSRLDQCLPSSSGNSNNHNVTFCNKENISYPSSDLESISKLVSRTPSSISKRKQPSSHTWKVKSEGHVLDQGIDRDLKFGNDYSGKKAYINKKPEKDNFHLSDNSIAMDDNPLHGPLVEISNNRFSSGKVQPGKMSSASPFKRPRNSRSVQLLKFTSFCILSFPHVFQGRKIMLLPYLTYYVII